MASQLSSADSSAANPPIHEPHSSEVDGPDLGSISRQISKNEPIAFNHDESFPTQLSDLIFSNGQCLTDTKSSSASSIYRTLDSLRKSTLSIPKRLASILEDSAWLTDYISNHPIYSTYPLIANERCGSWYIAPASKSGSAYFKSTDGHYGQWRLSTRRLNLTLLEVLGANGGGVLVDSTRRGKGLPDALRRTIPIWVAVWNFFLFGSVHDRSYNVSTKNLSGTINKIDCNCNDRENIQLGTSKWINGSVQNCGLEESEIQQIQSRIKDWVSDLKNLGLDFCHLRSKLKKPIRCVWVIRDEGEILPNGWIDYENSVGQERIKSEWNTLVLFSASKRVIGAEMSENGYIQGAGDDSEGWSCGLTPSLFWQYKDVLLNMPEDELPNFISRIVDEERLVSDEMVTVDIPAVSNISIAAGGSNNIAQVRDRSGKAGSKDLREKLPLVADTAYHLLRDNKNARILVMCETGRDLSVGVIVALLCLLYNGLGELDFYRLKQNIDKQMIKQRLVWITSVKPDANPSRSTLQAVNSFLIAQPS